MENIALNIKHLRTENKLSQAEFGQLFNLTRDNVASYERGTLPSLTLLSLIASHFKISLEMLLSTNLSELNSHEKYIVSEPEGLYNRETIDALKKVIASQEKTISALEMVIATKSKEENNTHDDYRAVQSKLSNSK